jgi:hypothetical protein
MERLETTVEAMRKKEITAKGHEVCNLPQATQARYFKDQQKSSSDAVKGIEMGKNDPTENCLAIERRGFGLIVTGILSSTWQFYAGNVYTNLYSEKKVKAGRKCLRHLYLKNVVLTTERFIFPRGSGFAHN